MDIMKGINMSTSEKLQEIKDFVKHYCSPCRKGEAFAEIWLERAIKLGIFEGATDSPFDVTKLTKEISILTPKKEGHTNEKR